MSSPELTNRLKGDVNKFLIVRVEDMYRHVTRPVPATRATIHSILFLTSGAATMKIGSDTYTIQPGQVLVVPAGQVFSFGEKDVNTGYLCGVHDDFLLGKFSSERLNDFEFLRVWGTPKLTWMRRQVSLSNTCSPEFCSIIPSMGWPNSTSSSPI
jgi:hypothetical protein